jgi:CheY-like chemotaxis protein
MGLKTATAHSCDDALAGLRSALPHVIFVDVVMPGMHAADFAEVLQAEPAWAGIPLIASTGTTPPAAGFIWARALLAKPFSVEEIAQALRTCGAHVDER